MLFPTPGHLPDLTGPASPPLCPEPCPRSYEAALPPRERCQQWGLWEALGVMRGRPAPSCLSRGRTRQEGASTSQEEGPRSPRPCWPLTPDFQPLNYGKRHVCCSSCQSGYCCDSPGTPRADPDALACPTHTRGPASRALPSHRGVAQSDRSETACLGWGGPGAQHRQHCPPGSAQRPAPTGAGGRPLAPVLVLTHLVPLVWLFMPLGNNPLSRLQLTEQTEVKKKKESLVK